MFMQHHTAFVAAEKIRVAAPRPRLRQGMAAGTLLETAAGWLPVEALEPGMGLQTWDGGMQPLVSISAEWVLPVRGATDLIHVPGGVLGLCSDLWLAPDQGLMIESTVAEEVLGSPVVLVRAGALAGRLGITRQHCGQPRHLFSLTFAAEEVVFANTGARVHCPGAGEGFFQMLSDAQAQALAALIETGAFTSADLARAV